MMQHRLRTCIHAGILLVAALGVARAEDYAITSFAGNTNVTTGVDGTGDAATFNGPSAVAIDAAKNLYVSDTVNNTIRKITPARVVTTLAGSVGLPGSADGTGSAARFNFPVGLAVDNAGNVYVADSKNCTIRKISPAGVVTTLAGSASQIGSTDGQGAAARFFLPYGIAVDAAGNVFVAEGGNHTIRKITPDGTVTTLAGSPTQAGFVNGTGSAARFSTPFGLTVDAAGNLYVADSGNNAIRRVTPAGVVTTVAGVSGPAGALDGPVAVARFNRPRGVSVDAAGNLYVADYGNQVIRHISAGGIVTTLAGSAEGGVGSANSVGAAARFYDPTGIVSDGTTIYVADSSNNSIRRGAPASQASLPVISVHPLDQVVSVGQAISFRVVAAGTSLQYMWMKNTAPIAGATGATYTINSAQLADVGTYTVRVTGAGGAVDSAPGTLSVEPVVTGPISLTARPVGQNVAVGQSVSFSVTATGPGLTYQWLKNGAAIAGATNSTYTIGSAQSGDVATYTVRVTSGATTVAASALLTVGSSSAISITTQPSSQSVAPGTTVVFNVEAFGSGLTYQWLKNDTAIAGATANSLTIANAQTSDAGTYTVRVTGSSGNVVSAPAVLAVGTGGGNPGGNPGGGGITSRLVNLSILTSIASAGDTFTMGYVVGGANTSGTKSVLIRAAGPTLGAAPFNIPGALADPKLELFAGQTKTSENDNWGGSQALSTAFASVGAFSYVSGTSLDAAAVATISAGDNSVRVSANGSGTGTVIAELYDTASFASMTAATPRLVNVSVLKHLGTGLTAGFVVDGTGPKRVLIRAVGPTIGAAPFNVAGSVADPQMTLFSTSTQATVASNDNWGGTAELTAAFAQVGAFALPSGSRDAALLATLQPGSYTVQVSGVNGTTGVAIVEVYEVP